MLAAALVTAQAQVIQSPRNRTPRAEVIEFFDKVQKDKTLTEDQRRLVVLDAIAAGDRALTIAPGDVVAMVYKNMLLRMRAADTTDKAERAGLIGRADALGKQVESFKKRYPGRIASMSLARNLSTQVPPDFKAQVDALHPLRVGGTFGQPERIRDRWCLMDYYPQIAHAAGVDGPVTVEVLVDDKGDVRAARPLRSPPLLDDSTVDCVQAWKFKPSVFNGRPTPVLMRITVVYLVRLGM